MMRRIFILAMAVAVATAGTVSAQAVEQEIIASIFQIDGGYASGYWIDGQMVVSFTYYQDSNYVRYDGILDESQFKNLLHRSMEELPNGLRSADIPSIEGISLIAGNIGEPSNADKPWLESNGFYANDSWFTSDKLSHMLGCYVLSVKLRGVHLLTGGNKYLAALETLFLGAVWEYKDYLWSWETYGYIGGDGFSYRDLVADLIGAIYSLQLLDPIAKPAKNLVKKFDEVVIARVVKFIVPQDTLPKIESVRKPKGIFYADKQIFWGRLIRVVLYDGTIVGVAATYHKIVDDEWFPHGTDWVTDESPENFGVSYNQEISWILGPYGQSLVEDCASDEIGLVVGECFILANEAQNAIFTSTDVPYLGGKENGGGWNNIHVFEASSVNIVWYALKKVNRAMLGQKMFQYGHTSIGITPGGFGASASSEHGQFYLAPYRGCGGTIGFTGDFTGMIQSLLH